MTKTRRLLAGAAIAALSAGTAAAGPLSSGWYLGVHAGYDFDNSSTSTVVTDGVDPLAFSADSCGGFLDSGGSGVQTFFYFDGCGADSTDLAAVNAGAALLDPPSTDGIIGGAQFGHLWTSGGFAWGVEADFGYMGQTNTHTTGPISFANAPFPALPGAHDACGSPLVTGGGLCGPATITETINRDWLATIRGRLGANTAIGYIYATGGLALGDSTYTVTYSDFAGALFADPFFVGFGQFPAAGCAHGAANPAACDYATVITIVDTRIGWTVGGGWEIAFGGGQWSFKLEGLYVDLGSVAASSSFTPSNAGIQCDASGGCATLALTADPTLSTSATYKEIVARAGLNFHF